MLTSALTFSKEATPVLVAGKHLTMTASPTSLAAFQKRVEAIGAKIDAPLVAVASGDFTEETGSPLDEEVYLSIVIGRAIAAGHAYAPTPVAFEAIDSASRRVAAIPEAIWREIAEAASEADDHERTRLVAEPAKLFCTAAGPLAGVLFAFGVACFSGASDDLGDPDPDPDAAGEADDAPAKIVPGLALVVGTDPDQCGQETGVYGVDLGGATYDGGLPHALEIDAAAFEEHTRKLGALARRASYFLIGRYD
jgi:hypothetical protein